jgi:hypothetical protein
MQGRLAKIAADYETDLDRVNEIASARFNAIVRAKLDEWNARFTRHTFKAWEGHGMMSIDVIPPVQGFTALEMENPEQLRGAISEIVGEAVEIVGAYNAMEQKVCLYCDPYETTKSLEA